MKAANPAYVMTANQPLTATPHQQKTAAAFFAAKNKKKTANPALIPNQQSSPNRQPHISADFSAENGHQMAMNAAMANSNGQCRQFASVLTHCPPVPPPPVLKRMVESAGGAGGTVGSSGAMGKVRVYLRVLTRGREDV